MLLTLAVAVWNHPHKYWANLGHLRHTKGDQQDMTEKDTRKWLAAWSKLSLQMTQEMVSNIQEQVSAYTCPCSPSHKSLISGPRPWTSEMHSITCGEAWSMLRSFLNCQYWQGSERNPVQISKTLTKFSREKGTQLLSLNEETNHGQKFLRIPRAG